MEFIALFVSIAYAQTLDKTSIPDAPPIMLRIAQAESGGRQFKDDGSLQRDRVTGDHIGIYQISITLWDKKAKSMGWDIRTETGNVNMALWLYRTYSTRPWVASEYGKYGWGNVDT